LTREAILNIDRNVHLLLTDDGTAFEEACVGVVTGYDMKGLIVQAPKERLRYLWKGINKITVCPGAKNHSPDITTTPGTHFGSA
jgi:hypothetical protein